MKMMRLVANDRENSEETLFLYSLHAKITIKKHIEPRVACVFIVASMASDDILYRVNGCTLTMYIELYFVFSTAQTHI
jgi:hypothetical protein